MRFTVFTPTYNRVVTLPRLYESLKRQSFQNFEWIVVDDGSTDSTENLIANYISEGKIEIHYFKQENGGKHVAVNNGLRNAKGEMFFIVDSDDFLTDNALEWADAAESMIKNKSSFCGIAAQKGYSIDKPIGTTFIGGGYLDVTYTDGRRNGISGDKAEIYYTKVLKQNPFPEFEGEKFVTESVVWERIASQGYKLRYFNAIVYICEYLDGGLSSAYTKHLEGSPKGWGKLISQRVEYGMLNGSDKWGLYNYYIARNKGTPYKIIAHNLNVNACKLKIGVLIFKVCRKMKQILDIIKN